MLALKTNSNITNIADLKRHVTIDQLEQLQTDFIIFLDRKETTIRTYRNALKHFLNYARGNIQKDIKRADLLNYKAYINDCELSTKTKSDYLRINKQFFNYTSSRGYALITQNIHGLKVSKESKKDALSKEDIQTINNCIDTSTINGLRLYILFNLCVCCGTRTIELERANISDLKRINGINYLYVQGKGKDDKSEPLEVPAALYIKILEYIADRPKKSPLFISTSNNSKNKRITTRTISKELKNLLIKAGYNSDRLTAHSLRHTSGTALYNLTNNVYTVQKHQRHANIDTTEIYIHAEDRKNRHTETDLYNYYYNESGTIKDQVLRKINKMNESELNNLLDLINIIQERG